MKKIKFQDSQLGDRKPLSTKERLEHIDQILEMLKKRNPSWTALTICTRGVSDKLDPIEFQKKYNSEIDIVRELLKLPKRIDLRTFF